MNVYRPRPLTTTSRGSAVRWRATMLGVFLLAAAVLYSGVFAVLYSHAAYSELEFAEPGNASQHLCHDDRHGSSPRGTEVHLDFATEIGPHGKHFPGVPRRDLTVHVGDGSFVQDIALKAQQSASPITLRSKIAEDFGWPILPLVLPRGPKGWCRECLVRR
jgi:hypothetical protein